MRMQIVIPMAGSGNRFKKAGYKELKPLIKIEKKYILEHVVDLFPGEDDFLFICSNNHLKKYNLEKVIRKIKPRAKIATIKSHKLGPVETLLRAKKYLKKDEEIIINYCDFSMIWNFKDFKKKVKSKKIHGAIVCYKGFHPHLLRDNFYAGVKTDKKNNLIETKEKYSYTKNKMESWHSSGTYYFKNGEIAVKYLEQIKKSNLITNNEFYVPWAYNLMKNDKLNSIVYPADYFCQWGTPEDLEEYLYWSRYFYES